MIARSWEAKTPLRHADGFHQYLLQTGVADYKKTPGCLEVHLLRRDEGAWSFFHLLSFWDSLESIRAYAGDDPEQAVLYPDDEAYELVPNTYVLHYQVVTDHFSSHGKTGDGFEKGVGEN